MKKITKKISGLLFLILGCMPWLFMLMFFIRQEQIRHQMEEQLEETMVFHSITVPENQVAWVKKGKEILINGQMFDIKTAHAENGYITFAGLYDDEETLLKKQLQESGKEQSTGDNKLLAQFIVSLQCLFFENENTRMLFNAQTNIFFLPHDAGLPAIYASVLTPPPRV